MHSQPQKVISSNIFGFYFSEELMDVCVEGYHEKGVDM